MGQAGIPLFYMQGFGGTQMRFRDLFNDRSLYWAWGLYKGQHPEGKAGVEANGRYSLTVNNEINGKWDKNNDEAARIFIEVIAYPCEIITRLDEHSLNDQTFAGLFVSKRPQGFGSKLSLAIGRKRFDGAGIDGICVVEDTYNTQESTIIKDLPIWLRIRLGCAIYYSLNVYFDYSLDGLHWINLYSEPGLAHFDRTDVAVGLYAANGAGNNDSSSKNPITASFDHFIMRPRSIN